jgi:hypothetical protein
MLLLHVALHFNLLLVLQDCHLLTYHWNHVQDLQQVAYDIEANHLSLGFIVIQFLDVREFQRQLLILLVVGYLVLTGDLVLRRLILQRLKLLLHVLRQ